MPNCFCLTPIGAAEPEKLQSIDDKMRLHFGAPPNADHWFLGWYNYIGFLTAMGKDWLWFEQDIDGSILCAKDAEEIAYWSAMRDVLDWLRQNYTSSAWAEIGRH